jgi:hypothetical protein
MMSSPNDEALGKAHASVCLCAALIDELVQKKVLEQGAWNAIFARAILGVSENPYLSKEAKAFAVAALGAAPRGANDPLQ